jgi:hypothetical protein
LDIPAPDLTILDAIRFTGEAWKRVQADSIVSCWEKTGILPQNPAMDNVDDFFNLPSDSEYDCDVVQSLIDRLAPDDPLSASEYISIDSTMQNANILDDDEILALAQGKEAVEEDPDSNKPKITTTEAAESIDKLMLFLTQEEDNLDISMNFMRDLSNIKKNLCRKIIDSKVQTKISSFLSTD